MKHWVYYIILLLLLSCFIGIQSSYAIVKQLIGEDFSVSEEQFGTWIVDIGIYEMVNMAARFVGVSIVLIAPIRRIKLTCLVLMSLQVFAYLLICITHFFPNLFSAFFPMANVLIGIGTGSFMLPYLLLYICFKDAYASQNEQG